MKLPSKLGLTLYTIAQFIVLVLVVVGSAIDMFRMKHKVCATRQVACLTLWGLKAKCTSTSYAFKMEDMFTTCTKRQDRFTVAEAFTIISALIIAASLMLAIIQPLCCLCGKLPLYLLNGCAIATLCVPWALMANAYNSSVESNVPNVFCAPFKEIHMKYGAGFSLLVVGWCIMFINTMFLLIVF